MQNKLGSLKQLQKQTQGRMVLYIRIALYLFLYRFLKQIWLILFLSTLIVAPQAPFSVALYCTKIDIITYSIIEHVRK
jgi:hypothetical protein